MLKKLPACLQTMVEGHHQAFIQACLDARLTPPTKPELQTAIATVFAASDFVADSCIRDPALLLDLIHSKALDTSRRAQQYQAQLQSALTSVTSELELRRVLRQLRRREMIRLIWRDILGLADFVATTTELSAFTDAVLNHTLNYLQPIDTNPIQLHIIALGKLGGYELNLSSDIDLIFAYTQDAPTIQNTHHTTEQFLTQMGQKFIRILNDTDANGFVFRVDMRLRPFGGSGPLVMNFSGLEHYYQEQGRNWERYALSKARVVTQNLPGASALEKILHAFVYRRYVDFSAIDSLRRLKETIRLEVKTKNLNHNIKRGPGGIREIEFINQTFRLIRGGQDQQLQNTNLLSTYKTIAAEEYLPTAIVKELTLAYIFLRNLEHRLQALADRQTQDLPSDPLSQARIAFAMGFADWASFYKQLEGGRQIVQQHFENMLASPTQKAQLLDSDPLYKKILTCWEKIDKDTTVETLLTELGFQETTEALRLLTELKASLRYRSMDSTGQRRLDHLMPLLLLNIGKSTAPLITLKRILDLLYAILRRSAYLALLLENPKASEQLVTLCAQSPWLAEQLRDYPLLLDDLLRVDSTYEPTSRTELAQNLTQGLLSIPSDDLEQQLDYLRRFKHSTILHLAIADLMNLVDINQVSTHLCDLAELILREVQQLAWQPLATQHGEPEHAEFAIIAYGKLGSLELRYQSDLDLVFLYDLQGEDTLTKGSKPILHSEFYLRLCQRFINLLAMRTATGFLYQVDTRLRPSGNAGLLVSTIAAFSDYQQKSAWTWEHQALVRARVLGGTPNLHQQFADIRKTILCRPRETNTLRQEVLAMREKMRSQAPKTLDLKARSGGLTDIEFIVQFSVLNWAARHPVLIEFTDNLRILQQLGQLGCLAVADVKLLSSAYCAYRTILHKEDLQQTDTRADLEDFEVYRVNVQRIWEDLFQSA